MNDGKDILKIHWKKLTLQLIRSVREWQTAMANLLQTGLHKRQWYVSKSKESRFDVKFVKKFCQNYC